MEEKKDTPINIIAELLAVHFSPEGQEPEYMSTREITEIFKEHIDSDLSAGEVAATLKSCGFQDIMIHRKLYWSVFKPLSP